MTRKYWARCDSHYGDYKTLIVFTIAESEVAPAFAECWRCHWFQTPRWWARLKWRTFWFLAREREFF